MTGGVGGVENAPGAPTECPSRLGTPTEYRTDFGAYYRCDVCGAHVWESSRWVYCPTFGLWTIPKHSRP